MVPIPILSVPTYSISSPYDTDNFKHNDHNLPGWRFELDDRVLLGFPSLFNGFSIRCNV